jgi:hypothetical protein
MADQITCEVYYEGDEDKIVLEGFSKAGLLSPHWQIAARGKEQKKKFDGWTGMVKQMALVMAPGVPSRFVALIDFDSFQPDQVYQRVATELAKHLPKELGIVAVSEPAHPRLRKMIVSGEGHERIVVMIPVGLPESALLRDHYKLEEFAMDDYLLNLIRDPSIYEAAGKKESKVKDVPQDLVLRKFDEMGDLLRKNGLKITRAKRLLDFFRVLIGFRAAPATLHEQFVEAAIETLPGPRLAEFRQLFHPLIDDLDEAAKWLESVSPPKQP